jgi:hypothetical protein
MSPFNRDFLCWTGIDLYTAIEGTVDLTFEVKALQLPMLLQGVGALTSL